MLCVSIHDVAPATWSDCLRLVEAVRAVADIPLTWLVVPHYHFRPEQSLAMEACLNVALERGDELALHGYSHLDTEAGSGGLRARFLRNVYTRSEGEFAALTESEARRRLELGLDWFAARGWTPTGFVPPAWLLGEGAWRALRDAPFAYTTTFSHFHCLPGAGERRPVARPHCQQALHDTGGRPGYRGDASASIQGGSGAVQTGRGNQSVRGPGNTQFDARNWTGANGTDLRHDVPGRADAAPLPDLAQDRPQDLPEDNPNPVIAPATSTLFTQNNRHGTHAILSPSLVYAARNRGGRILSPRIADATASVLARSPLVRFSLHPPDARYPELVRHIQRTLERLLESREAVTKAEFARRVTQRLNPRFTSTDPTSHPASNPDPSHSSPQAVHSVADRTSHPG
nr:polysaccharide deacetylase family protein [Telluria mixta]